MAKDRFVYRGKDRTVESVVRKSKQGGGLYDSYLKSEFNMFKPKEGENNVRIMPPTWEDTEKYGDGWEIGVYLHYSVGPDNGAYLCLDKMNGEVCPICEARRNTRDEEEQDQLKPSYRCLCWVIDRDNEKAGPSVWGMPMTLFRDINSRSVDKKSNTPILIDDPEEGYDIVFNREGTDMRTKYTAVEVLREASPIHDDERLQARWLEYVQANPLPDCLVLYDAEHIEKVLFGKVSRKDESAEAEAPASLRSSRRGQAEPEAEVEPEQPSRRSLRAGRNEVEPEAASSTSRRRALLSEDTEEEAPSGAEETAAESDSPVAQARRSLDRLKTRRERV